MLKFFKLSKQAKIVAMFIFAMIIIGFSIAYFYYDHVNKSEDQRVISGRIKLDKFDNLMKARKYSEALPLIDTVYNIYDNALGYEGSFEFGLLFNNRASVFLSMTLYDSLISKEEKENLLKLAFENITKSISIYEQWIDSVGKLNKEEIQSFVASAFRKDKVNFEGKDIEAIIKKRVDDIIFAKMETPRRLSVSYTNLGIIQRHQYKQQEALISYEKAITLWKDNFTARSNFNVLMGKPPEDRSIIEKLFPPDRNKKD
ncbi:MAG: hypothetical protein A2X12_05350 [Bacteroidetes bacterium GWE2_29_8]|nr:MAG: hypothetical protein A2X12_05350 [Bacteroidetes bacterium GWE2_29_8]OFY25315.1 MAG: hypothetical protein A2X02_09915 [Bacteroidetes bacterium GWF2_29_10]